MEPLSLIGGIVAVGQASETICKLAKTIYQVSYNAGNIEKDVKFFASQVDIFGSTVSSAHSSIREYYIKCPEFESFTRFEELDTLEKLAAHVQHLMFRVESLLPSASHSETRLNFWHRFQWMLEKDERKELCLSMDRVQVNFLLIMHQLSLEALQRRACDPSPLDQQLCDFKREIRQHKRLIRNHMKTMLVLKDKLDSLPSFNPPSYNDNYDLDFDDLEKDLLRFGHELVRNRASTTRSFSTRSFVTSSSSVSHSSNRGMYRNGNRNQSYAILPTSFLPVAMNGSDRSTSSLSNVVNSLAIPSPSSRVPPDSPQSPNWHNFDAPEPLRLTRSPSSAESPDSKASPSNPQMQHRNESNYMVVQEMDDIPTLNVDHNFAIQGYINNSFEPTNALVNDEFPVNVISQTQAAALGLEIVYENGNENTSEEPEEDIYFNFGDGPQIVIGKACFEWKSIPGKGSLRPLNLACFVCKNVPFPTPIILGQAYTKKKRYFKRER